MRILVVPTTDWLGHPFPSRLHHIFERLSKQHEVHVLRFFLSPQERLKTNTIVHEAGEAGKGKLAFHYLMNAYSHHRAVHDLIKEAGIDRVVVSNLLPGYIAARSMGKQVTGVFDLSDFFPASGAGYYFSHESVAGRVTSFALEMILRSTMRLLGNVVTCSHALLDYARSVGVPKSWVITNGVDEFFLSCKNGGEDIKEKYGLNGYVTIGYIGSIEFWVDMLPLLHAVKRLARDYKVKLFLIGSGLRTRSAYELWEEIRELKISENVTWLRRFLPYAEVPSHIAAMDICTIPFDHEHPVAYYSAPNKLWEYFALCKPVITTPIPEPLIQAGPYVDVARERQDYERIVTDYIRDPDKYKDKAVQAQSIARKNTWTEIAQLYERLLKSLD